jgi:SSS family transporter
LRPELQPFSKDRQILLRIAVPAVTIVTPGCHAHAASAAVFIFFSRRGRRGHATRAMSDFLSLPDAIIVIAYIVGTTLLGAWFSGRQRDVNTYFVSDRNVSWWLVLVSIVATETSTVTFLSVPGVAFNPEKGNLTFLQLSFGYIVGRILIAWLLLPSYLRGDLLSAYQLLRQRFSPAVQRTASGIFLLTRAVADGLRLYLAALLLQQVTGWDTAISVLGTAAITMVYTFLGGMQAVIWTDLVQFLCYIAGAVVAGGFILHQTPGGMETFVMAGQAAGKFQILDFSFDLTRQYTFWAGLFGGAFFTMASHGADQMMVQRYLCSRSLQEARVALVLSGLVVLVQFLLFLLIGVGLYVLWQLHVLPFPADIKNHNDKAFGFYIVHALPVGIVGLLVAAVLASTMSSLSSSLNSASSAFVADFYRPLRPGRSAGHYLVVSRSMTLVWGLTRIVVALAAIPLLQKESVVNQVLRIAGFTTGMILGLFLLGRMARPVGSRPALAAVVAGFLSVLVLWWFTQLAWPWYPLVGTLVTVAVALMLQFLGFADGSSGDGSKKPGFDEPG